MKMADDSIQKELEELKRELEELKKEEQKRKRKEREEVKKAEELKRVEAEELQQKAEEMMQRFESGKSDAKEMLDELLQTIKRDYENLSPTSAVVLFALGVAFGHALSSK